MSSVDLCGLLINTIEEGIERFDEEFPLVRDLLFHLLSDPIENKERENEGRKLAKDLIRRLKEFLGLILKGFRSGESSIVASMSRILETVKANHLLAVGAKVIEKF